jgi:hypothetical protein
MNARGLIVIALLVGPLCNGLSAVETQGRCQIVVSPETTMPEQVAARELARYLGRLYPSTSFPVSDAGPSEGQVIYVGTSESAPHLMKHLGSHVLAGPESYVVTTAVVDGRQCGLILGADPAGVAYGVHGLLRHLGCGFYLSFDTMPKPKAEAFSFDSWDLSDRPLVPTRLVFNWHNFLSGCSTWNLEHWQKWIVQSQKLGYNAVMVHAYGNNPMAGFSFRGLQKPVGYLSSTQVGRDWSTNHVNDVRRLYGGHVFDSSVFGADAAIEGTDLERTEAAQRLMADAFACAEERGVDVYFAVDVDTTSANPQELILALPAQARFQIDVTDMAWMGQEAGKAWLANPDSSEGYEFYKAQAEELLRVYPQIDCLVVWHRKHRTPWMGFAAKDMPKPWQEEYAAEIKRTPEAEELWHSLHMFAQAKVVRAFGRALTELGRKDIKLAFGSWDFDYLPAADRFMPEDVAFIPLDWMVLRDASIFDTAEQRASVAEVAAHRDVIPVAWAHHDDGNYVGRPYTPYSKFYDRLTEMKCQTAGYGIIHWTTKPLDLYFTSLVDQSWAKSKNEPLEKTCCRMAADLVGEKQAKAFGDYLVAWVTTMPKIGRETSDFFIDHELGDIAEMEASQRSRLDRLAAVDRSAVSPEGREWLDYFAGLEEYVHGIYRTEDAFNRAKKQYAAGNLNAARETMAACQPEKIIEQYAKFSQLGGLTRGEEGLIVSMNTRWLPHYTRFRQTLGLEAIRYNLAPTSHDLLAQSRGVFTFYFGADKSVWQCRGAHETGAEEFELSPDAVIENTGEIDAAFREVCRTGIETGKPLAMAVRPIMGRRGKKGLEAMPLAPGKYQLTLLMLDPSVSAEGDRVFDVSVSACGKKQANERVDACRLAGGANRVVTLRYSLGVDTPGDVKVELTPVKGKALICGAVLEPVGRPVKEVR